MDIQLAEPVFLNTGNLKLGISGVETAMIKLILPVSSMEKQGSMSRIFMQ